MADIGDVQGFEKTYRDQLDAADIDDRDREQIRSLVRRRNVEGIQKSTNTGTLNRCRLAAERAPCPLVDMDLDDFYTLHDTLELEHGLSDGTLRNYRKAVKRFAEHMEFDWTDEIDVGEIATADDTVDPATLLTDDEVDAMLDAATHPRDKAIMAMLRNTGLRVGALCNLRLRDVDFTESAGEFTVHSLPGNKEAEGTRPFTWARAHLVNWLDVHPFRGDESAPLFAKRRDRGDESGRALSTSAVRQMLYAAADRAEMDIPRERVQPHNWRDTTFAGWKLDGLSDQQIKHRGFHVADSDMLARYGPIDDQEMNDTILDHYDIGDGKTARTPDLDQCPQCQTALRDGTSFCPTCGLAFDEDARERLDSFRSEARERTVETEDAEKRRTVMKLAEAADVDPAEIERMFS